MFFYERWLFFKNSNNMCLSYFALLLFLLIWLLCLVLCYQAVCLFVEENCWNQNWLFFPKKLLKYNEKKNQFLCLTVIVSQEAGPYMAKSNIVKVQFQWLLWAISFMRITKPVTFPLWSPRVTVGWDFMRSTVFGRKVLKILRATVMISK